ncbi:eukaryotic aspartyl protease family protein [Actinidia rufa]|uniref:Eukaryotic aspartyl protease family protein n=1 Tax=Actinidia rufa TaxID=165716 RepID=A0A7J0GGR2_9ERIC|nr:eukaryotic aspartyl protease family protein [Actinidia rufa]
MLLLLIHHKLFLLLLVTVFVSSCGTTTTKPPRLVTKLIHSDSIFSPYRNPSVTISQHVRSDMKSSMSRYEYLKSRTKLHSSSMDDVRGGLIPEAGAPAFLVNFSIGQPPVPQLAVMDTGSSLLWVQCLPCIHCFHQLNPIFDPYKSSTYDNLTCESPYCVVDPYRDNCDYGRNCSYSYGYVDGTTTSGDLGKEELTFTTSDEGTITIPDTVLGCGHENHVNYNILPISGVLGLGDNRKLSLVSHLGSKFSYCIGNISDPRYEYNQLIIGDGAKIEGYSTPMEVFDGQYYLTLEGISVGEKRLEINQMTFKRDSSGGGGLIIDSGTTYIHLVRDGFDPLDTEVQNLIGGLLQRVDDRTNQEKLCFKGSVSRDLIGFPVVTFHFADGADLELDVEAMFKQDGNIFCMGVVPTRFPDPSMIGIRAQQYYNVAYDLIAKKVYFQRIDCELLED